MTRRVPARAPSAAKHQLGRVSPPRRWGRQRRVARLRGSSPPPRRWGRQRRVARLRGSSPPPRSGGDKGGSPAYAVLRLHHAVGEARASGRRPGAQRRGLRRKRGGGGEDLECARSEVRETIAGRPPTRFFASATEWGRACPGNCPDAEGSVQAGTSLHFRERVFSRCTRRLPGSSRILRRAM